jgi:ferredoxin-thioredoxin reductase catalytic subunit
MSSVKARRAKKNRAYVRMLLWQRQPAFATALASAEQYFTCSACPCRQTGQDDDRDLGSSGSATRTQLSMS